MKFYSYDPTTSVFTGEILAQENPVRKGEFLDPAFSTRIEPPVPGVNQIPAFLNGAWVLKPNFVGMKYWTTDGLEHTMMEVGVQLPDGALSSPPGLTDTQKWAAYQSKAKAALRSSDVVVIRCSEADVQVPQEWKTYRAALRAIISAETGVASDLPSVPAYPAGT